MESEEGGCCHSLSIAVIQIRPKMKFISTVTRRTRENEIQNGTSGVKRILCY